MIDKPTQLEALEAAIHKAGSQAELARICGVSPTAVWKWAQSSKRMPAEYVLKTESATGVSKHDLRPDIYPRESMVDGKANLFCDAAPSDDRYVSHDGQHTGRFIAVDFNRADGLKGAAQ